MLIIRNKQTKKKEEKMYDEVLCLLYKITYVCTFCVFKYINMCLCVY